MKKIVNLIMILVLTFAFTFALPQKEAEAVAWGLAVPAGITIGAGAYTVGAIALAGVVGIAGYDTYSEEINAHAQRTWENGTQLSKDSMNAMINAAKDMGSALTATDAGFNTWLDGIVSNLAKENVNLIHGDVIAGNFGLSSFDDASYTGKQFVGNTTGDTMCINATCMNSFRIEIFSSKLNIVSPMGSSNNTFTTVEAFAGLTRADLKIMINTITNVATFNAVVNEINKGLGIATGVMTSPALDSIYTQGVSQTSEAWQDMKDAGLVLPVDNVVPSYEGNAVNYNAETDVYTGVDGGVINPADVTWSFPQPRIRTGEELDVTVPPGVYVDNPAGVYNPALPDTLVVPDIAIPTTTNITTGVTTEIPKTGTGEPPIGGTTPKGEPLNPFNAKPVPIAALTGLFQLLAALIFYLIRLFTFIATLAFIAPTPIDNPYFLWFIDATFYGIKPFPLVQNLALFFLGFSVYRSVRRVFG